MGIKALLIAEQKNGKLSNVSLELITAAKEIGAEITSIVLAESADPIAGALASKGGGKVLAVSNPALKNFNDEIYGKILTAIIKKYQPQIVMASATFYGKALMARLAAMNDAAMTSDITGISLKSDKVVAKRPTYGGNVLMDISAKGGKPLFLTIRPKIFAESTGGDGQTAAETIDASLFESKMAVKERVGTSGQTVALTEADVVVSVGRGIRGPENIPLIQKLADSLNAAFGASRAIVDAGWIAYPHQVGQTGKTVNPKLYFAIGISGAIQHLVGMQSSKTIVAVNRDKDAPIFNIASYGIVGDLFEIVPALTAKFQAAK